jgi:hypothetical protein
MTSQPTPTEESSKSISFDEAPLDSLLSPELKGLLGEMTEEQVRLFARTLRQNRASAQTFQARVKRENEGKQKAKTKIVDDILAKYDI